MHEMSLAMNIVDLAVSKAQSEGSQKINQIEIEIGSLAGVMIDSLEFCFEAASKETIAEGADFKIIEVQGKGHCQGCDFSFAVDSLIAQCHKCNEYCVVITQGKELRVVSITVDE